MLVLQPGDAPGPPRGARASSAPAERSPPSGTEREPRPLPNGGGKKALGARSAGGAGVRLCGSLGAGEKMVQSGLLRRTERRLLRAGATGISQSIQLRGRPSGARQGIPGLSPRPLCPAPAGDKHPLNNGHVCSNMISPNNAE